VYSGEADHDSGMMAITIPGSPICDRHQPGTAIAIIPER
jgi:hypothetical protein